MSHKVSVIYSYLLRMYAKNAKYIQLDLSKDLEYEDNDDSWCK